VRIHIHILNSRSAADSVNARIKSQLTDRPTSTTISNPDHFLSLPSLSLSYAATSTAAAAAFLHLEGPGTDDGGRWLKEAKTGLTH
jgi:hypothetical protein